MIDLREIFGFRNTRPPNPQKEWFGFGNFCVLLAEGSISMGHGKLRGILERGAAPNLWRNTLSRIPTVYGRLVYLASLRNNDTGRYEHAGLELVYGERESDRALRDGHAQTFAEWLCYDLERQKADLDAYLAGLPDSKAQVLANWVRLQPYRNLAPATAAAPSILLFLGDFEALLSLLRSEYAGAGED